MTRPRSWNSTLRVPRQRMARGGPIERRARLESRTPIRKRNPKRAAWKFERNFHSVAYVEFTKSRPCWSCGSCREIETSHVLEGRKMGGCGGDWTVTAPQCRTCHREWGAGPDRFLRARGWTWDHAERAVAEHQAAWERYGGEG